MADDTEILQQMFKPSALIDVEIDKYNKTFITLQEQKAANSKAVIRYIPADAIILNIDDFMSLDNIFQGKHGECKRADYVIISEEKKCIIFIELKETSDIWKDIVKQLQGSQCFMDYCQNLGKTFWQEQDFLTGYQHRFVCIGHSGSMPKKPTKITRIGDKHNSPEKALKVEYKPTIYFKELASLGK